jgi:MFS family permease
MGRYRSNVRFRRGWAIVVALGVTETTSYGILYYAFAVLLGPMERELGWSRAQLTGAFSLALLVSGVAAVPVGWWVDRHGARVLMTVGSCLATALTLLWAGVRDPLAFYALWAAMGVAWAMTFYEPAFAVVAQWFRRRRARALTVLTGMAAFASTIFFPLTAWLAEQQGWRAALVTLAVVLAVVTIPLHALVLRRRPEDHGLTVDGLPVEPDAPSEHHVSARAAVRGGAFWWLAAAFALEAAITIGLAVHLIPYLLDVGHGAAFAAWAAGLVGAMQFVGRVLIGPLGDRLPLRRLVAGLFGLTVLALALLGLIVSTEAGALLFAVLFGAAKGALTTARPALIADLYGRGSYGTISGAMSATGVLARAAAPLGIGLAYDAAGGYAPVLWALTGMSVVGLAALLRGLRQNCEAPISSIRPVAS